MPDFGKCQVLEKRQILEKLPDFGKLQILRNAILKKDFKTKSYVFEKCQILENVGF